MNSAANSQISENTSRKTSSSSESSSSSSDSEGTYTLTTTSESEDGTAETVDENSNSVYKNSYPVYKYQTPEVEYGTNAALCVTPEPEELLVLSSNTGTYKIKTDTSLELRNGGLTMATTPATESKTGSARRRHSFASPEKQRAADASWRCPAFARLRRLPLLRCAAAAYSAAKTSSSLGWAVAAAEAGARLALAPVACAASPFRRVCSGPQNCLDRAICKGLDVAEALFPCIVMRPCQMCCGDEDTLGKL